MSVATRQSESVLSKVVAMLVMVMASIDAKYQSALAAVMAMAKELTPASYDSDLDSLHKRWSAAQVEGFMVMIVGGAALIVGFFVVATVNDALPSISNSDLASDKDTTLQRIGQAMVLGGVVLIVIGVTMVLRTLRSV